MFGHPSTVKEAVPVWKAHLCQPCEREILCGWLRPPIDVKPSATEAPAEPPANAEGERVPPCAECPHMKAKLDNVSGILVNALRHLTLPQMHNLGVQIANRSNATFTANTEAHTATEEKGGEG